MNLISELSLLENFSSENLEKTIHDFLDKNQLGMGHNLPATLSLIAEGAVRAVSTGTTSTIPDGPVEVSPSAVIWIYDEAKQEFDPESRISAGEPEGASFDDLLPAEDNSYCHFEQDVIEIIYDDCWDMLIAHPPCTKIHLVGFVK